VSIRKWAGNEWENVADSSTSGAGPLPKVVCGGDRIDAFDASTLKMTWTPSAGWTKAPGSPDDPSPAGTAAGSAFPTFTDSGDVFWLTAANEVTWFDPRSGTLAPTGLTLLPGQADSPQNLRAARSGSSFFACVDRSVGLPGDTAKAPDPQCGFAPLPKK
jgi:hypothetical protein